MSARGDLDDRGSLLERAAPAVLFSGLAVGSILAVVGASRAGWADFAIYAWALWISRIAVLAAVLIMVVSGPARLSRVRAMTERPGWSAAPTQEADLDAVHTALALCGREFSRFRDYPEALQQNARLRRELGTVRLAIPEDYQESPRLFQTKRTVPRRAYLWVELSASPPSVVIARRGALSPHSSGIDHRALDERFTFDPPGRVTTVGAVRAGHSTNEVAYDQYLRELLGPATGVLLEAPEVFWRLGIVDDKLFAVCDVNATKLEQAADLLLSIRDRLSIEVPGRYRLPAGESTDPH